MISSKFLLAPFLLAAIVPAEAAITQYTDRSLFLAALAGNHATEDFSSLAAGDHGSTTLSIFGSNPGNSLLLETRNQGNTFAGDNYWVADNGNLDKAFGASTSYTDQLRLSASGGFFAIGADWFLGDIDDNHLAGSVILTFSDNTTFTITSGSQADSFRGFISDSPLTSVLVSASDPSNVAGWVTIDNVTIPEPSSGILAGLAGAGALLRRKRTR